MNIDDLFILDEIPDALSRDDNLELLNMVQKGDSLAKEKFVKHNLRLVIYEVINKFCNVRSDKRDLVAAGCIGLLRAIDYYDFDKNIEFSTYATRCIDNEIRRYLGDINDKYKIVSFENSAFCDDEDGANYLNVLDCGINIEGEYLDNEMFSLLNDFVNSMPSMHKEIFGLYFGFFGKKYTQEEIAKLYNCSRQWIAKIIENDLKKMRKCMNDYGFYGVNDIKGKWLNRTSL